MRDRDLRDAVREWLDIQHAGDADTLIVEEMGVWSGSVRIDIAIINGEMTGIELKSDCDTLARLPLQAELYSKVFDRVVLVVGARHLEEATRLIPKWWGIRLATIVSGRVSIRKYRLARANPAPDPLLIAQLLWRDEALTILEEFNLSRGWKQKKAKLLHERLSTEVPLAQLNFSVRAALKKRNTWLRYNASNKLDMSVNPNLNPTF